MGIKKKRYLQAIQNSQKQDKTGLEAIAYLVENEVAFDEWAEAAMYHAVREVIQSDGRLFSTEELDKMISEAKRS